MPLEKNEAIGGTHSGGGRGAAVPPPGALRVGAEKAGKKLFKRKTLKIIVKHLI